MPLDLVPPRDVGSSGLASGRRLVIPAIGPDGALEPVEKMDAHRRGLLHLAVSVFVFSGDRLLIQRRAAGKYHCGGLWANTVCSHPNWGESLADGARRRLREELGVDLPLSPAGVLTYRAEVSDGLIEHERVQVFRADADADALNLAPDPAEVSETAWVRLDALRADVADDPARYAPWFRIYVARWDELGF